MNEIERERINKILDSKRLGGRKKASEKSRKIFNSGIATKLTDMELIESERKFRCSAIAEKKIGYWRGRR